MDRQIRVLLADDHACFRESIGEMLRREPDIAVVGMACDATSAVIKAEQTQPDIILMDIQMPGLFSFEAVRQIASVAPAISVIFLSAFPNDTYISMAIDVRAKGYVVKKEGCEQIILALREVASGGAYFSKEISDRIIVGPRGVRLAKEKTSRLAKLSRRLIEMLVYIAKGYGKKQIAAITGRSIKTIDHHVGRLMKQLDIHDRVGLTKFAIREGLAEPE
ncbi:MAG: response regulator transcription factor [Phycisphaerae bacterium]|nr:response regulator transcription factor [Phycisphaerae bacterium]